MNKTIDQVNIYAYLAPHPMDEHSGAEGDYLEWIPGFVNEYDEVEELEAIYRDCNVKIYDQIIEITEKHFKKSVENMWPILADINLNSMQVAIDILGMIGYSKTALAGYMYGLSDQLKGDYVFKLDLNLLVRYLKKNENKEPLDFHDISVWDHELIHLLDHKAISVATLYHKSQSPFENFKYYIIKYREEGIADLYYVLNGHTKIKNINEAIDKFKEASINRKKGIDFTSPSNDKSRDALFEGLDFYLIGPWLILEMLRDMYINWDDDIIEKCIESISKNEAVPLETIQIVIKRAIEIQPDEFLHHYSKYFDEGFFPLI
jgi:hypothetical protein